MTKRESYPADGIEHVTDEQVVFIALYWLTKTRLTGDTALSKLTAASQMRRRGGIKNHRRQFENEET